MPSPLTSGGRIPASIKHLRVQQTEMKFPASPDAPATEAALSVLVLVLMKVVPIGSQSLGDLRPQRNPTSALKAAPRGSLHGRT